MARRPRCRAWLQLLVGIVVSFANSQSRAVEKEQSGCQTTVALRCDRAQLRKAAAMVQDLQRVINAASRAEGKVKRLGLEREERQRQWKAWENELKKAYAKEKSRFTAAMTTNATDNNRIRLANMVAW